ncbi:MAG: Gfo/Idh/MocA family oxidoreductase [Bacteroidia bacterium]|nr:Gfo/Idh/MocA family oxidoreductase [Bacteroidia bacterium]
MNSAEKPAAGVSRRTFLSRTALTAGGLVIVPRYVLGGPGHVAPSDKLNIAAIGANGKGRVNINLSSALNKLGGPRENIVALCDVDDNRLDETFRDFPKAKRYRDYRRMLEEMHTDIDAVIVSTPDHMHAVQAMAAMKLGKHVYVEKPLTHDVYEARMLTQAAKEYKVVTQMGNQGSSGDSIRQVCEWIWSGVIGDVTEVHAWTNRPVWPQGLTRPKEKPAVPAYLDWDLWLGTAPERPYHPGYHPFSWRGWWDFGTGALGDMACHILDPAFRALKLGYPISVEASASISYVKDWDPASRQDGVPSSSIIHFEYPARTDENGKSWAPVKLSWYDGGLQPQRPEELADDEPFGGWDGGVLFIGSKGKMTCELFGDNPTLLPTSRMKDFQEPPRTLKRYEDNHQTIWVKACKGELSETTSPFSYAGPFTETILMGNLALRCLDILDKFKGPAGKLIDGFGGRRRLHWDGPNMRITNYEPANQFVKREYRKGWSL